MKSPRDPYPTAGLSGPGTQPTESNFRCRRSFVRLQSTRFAARVLPAEGVYLVASSSSFLAGMIYPSSAASLTLQPYATAIRVE
jgi:hypothetical protein